MVGAFLLAMAQLTIIVGALALGATMSLAVQERTREIGVLRAIGATPRSIVTMVQAEGLLIAVMGSLARRVCVVSGPRHAHPDGFGDHLRIGRAGCAAVYSPP